MLSVNIEKTPFYKIGKEKGIDIFKAPTLSCEPNFIDFLDIFSLIFLDLYKR